MQNSEVGEGVGRKVDLYARMKSFALRVIRLYGALPKTVEAQVIGKQLLRSGTSIGAQYAEAKRARSKAEFEAKLQGALQELEETGYWLDLLVEARIMEKEKLELLIKERNELTALLVTSINTSKKQM